MSEPSDWTAPDSGRPPPDRAWSPGGIPPGPPARPKPGVIPLRPLTVTDILDGAVAYVRSNPAVTLGFSAVVITITQLIELPVSWLLLDSVDAAALDAAATGQAGDPEAVLDILGAALGGAAVSGVVSFVATTVLSGLLIMVLGQAVLGRRMALGAAWAATRGRLPGLLGVSLLTTLLLLLVVCIGLAPSLIAALIGSTSASTLLAAAAGMIVATCLAIYLGVAWSMITPAYVLEGVPAMVAFRRSYDLVRPQWWRVFGILLLGGLIAVIVSFVLALPFGFVTTLLEGSFDPTSGTVPQPGLTGSVVTAIGAIVAGTLTAPFSAGITGLLYFDQRMRREAFDLELLRATESSGGSPAPGGPGETTGADRDEPDPQDPDPQSPTPPR